MNEMRKLKIFSDKRILENNQPHVTMLYPFFGKNSDDFEDLDQSGKFDAYIRGGSQFFEMTSLENADLAIFPIPWEHVFWNTQNMEKFDFFHDSAEAYGIPTVIFFWSDSFEPVSIKNTIVFRTSFYRSKRKNYEYAMPSWSEDVLSRYFLGKLPIREKMPSALIGYTGVAPEYSFVSKIWNNTIKPRLKIRPNPPNQGEFSSIRSEVLKILQKDESVRKHLIIRNHFWGNLPDMTERTRQRSEFVQNLMDCDYPLCMRGSGNFSSRFYEILCCGRIPLFVDTDCVLPYDFEIDWKKHCLWVDETEIKKIGETIVEYHNQISPQDFINHQYKCREIWEEFISPIGFFKNFFRHFAF